MSFTHTKPTVQEPEITKMEGPGNVGESKQTHPAYGQVSVSRVSGHANLYGSDFSHNGYVTLTIQRSELVRSLSNDWHFARDNLIEIALSEAQWATLVSSFNVGSGVPCTLMWKQGEGYIPRLPDPKKRTDQFAAEMAEDFEEAHAALDALIEQIEGLKLSGKKTDALLSQVNLVKGKLDSSAPFVAEQFSEHMESETERAKVEIHGYATNLFQRAGVAALAGDGPLAIDAAGLPLLKDGDEQA